MNDKQKMIEKLKTTWTAFGGLSPEEQKFLKAHSEDVGILCYSGELGSLGGWSFDSLHAVYRLQPNYQEPEKKRWFFNLEHGVRGFSNHPSLEDNPNWIEINPEQRAYLEDNRRWSKSQLSKLFDKLVTPPDWMEQLQVELDKADGRWVEYPIYIDESNEYSCEVAHHSENRGGLVQFDLIELPCIVGFGGVQFEGQEDDTWYLNPVAMQCPSGEIAPCWIEDKEGKAKPATPKVAKFWVEK